LIAGKEQHDMDILIIGGTRFLGRALVEAAVPRGHRLTLFNRGRSNPGLFPEVEQLVGDRDGGLDILHNRHWDAVIDTCGYVPRVVRQSAELLAENTRCYVFISTLSVYASTAQPGLDEKAPLAVMEDPQREDITGETYGPLKVLCERVVQEALPQHSLIIRPGLIVGPHDVSDRFTYWPARLARGGEVLCPGRPERGVQFIDVRDLAEWTIHLLETGCLGIYNADGAPGAVSMGDLLQACRRAGELYAWENPAQLVWVDESFLLKQGVGPWMEMPLWIPESDPDSAGFFAFDVSRAHAAGLTHRSLDDTVRATLSWALARPGDYAWRAGLAAARETELLQAWKQSGQI
jgi:2'-hydroxyisoflavone reductase